MSEPHSSSPVLEAPPIEEVVCGFIFDPIEALDALEQGVYWNEVKARFPNKQIHPALMDADVPLSLPLIAPIRAWFISATDDLLIQVQSNRFYVNWRRRDAKYPRFSDNGAAKGLCTQALEEFDGFCQFILRHLGVAVRLRQLELQKQDLLRRGEHWSNLTDLGRLMPVMTTFATLQTSERSGFVLRMSERDDHGTTAMRIQTEADEVGTPSAIRLDFHGRAKTGSDSPRETFERTNSRLNNMFFGLMAPEHLGRFGKARS